MKQISAKSVLSQSNIGGSATHLALGLIVVVAALLKLAWIRSATVHLVVQVTPFGAWLYVVELLLGIALMVMCGSQYVSCLSLPLFMLFAGMSLWKVLIGEESCGCFGVVDVHPLYTLGLDLTAVGAVLLTTDMGNTRLVIDEVEVGPSARRAIRNPLCGIRADPRIGFALLSIGSAMILCKSLLGDGFER